MMLFMIFFHSVALMLVKCSASLMRWFSNAGHFSGFPSKSVSLVLVIDLKCSATLYSRTSGVPLCEKCFFVAICDCLSSFSSTVRPFVLSCLFRGLLTCVSSCYALHF
jgi:hypothetical protein